MKVLVTGGRHYADRARLHWILSQIHERTPIDVIIEGGHRFRRDPNLSADRFAREWAEANGVECQTYPADWDRYGRAAGPIRNQHMLELNPDLVVAFPDGPLCDSRGTRDMVIRARQAGFPTLVYPQGGDQPGDDLFSAQSQTPAGAAATEPHPSSPEN